MTTSLQTRPRWDVLSALDTYTAAEQRSVERRVRLHIATLHPTGRTLLASTCKSHDIPVTEDEIRASLPNSPLRETENALTVSDSSLALPSISQSAHPPLRLDKSLPASPLPPTTPTSGDIGSKFVMLGRSSSGGAIDLQERTRRRRPVLLDDQSSLLRLSAIIRARTSDPLSEPR
jgi:hypothetical protein